MAPSKKQKKLSILVLFVFSLFWTTIVFAEAPNKVTITSPKNHDEVGARVIVKGSCDIKDDSHIWVLVHLKLLQDQWWPQPRPVLDDEGNWQAFVYIGQPQDIGMDFEIAVATFSKTEEARILEYHEHGRKTNQWLPISFPKTSSPIEIITVRKVR